MKRIMVIIMALLLSGSAFGQKDLSIKSDSIPTIKKVKRVKLPPIDYRHEFRLGVGVVTMPRQIMTSGPMAYLDKGYGIKGTYAALGAVFSAYYGYRIIKGLKVTATFSFTNGKNPFYNIVESTDPSTGNVSHYPGDEVIGKDHFYHYRITPAIQYEWYNRGIVTMYSDIGCTFDFAYRKTTLRGEQSSAWDYPNAGGVMAVRPNVTPFGITVGKKLYGYAELFSFGPRGLFNCGIGYRFK